MSESTNKWGITGSRVYSNGEGKSYNCTNKITAQDLYHTLTEYEKTVQTKVFDFLFKLASSNSRTSIGKHTIASRASGIQMQKGNLSFIVTRGNNLKYTVMDLRGRPAMTGSVSANESVDLSTLNNGVYILQVQGERAIRIGISK